MGYEKIVSNESVRDKKKNMPGHIYVDYFLNLFPINLIMWIKLYKNSFNFKK